VDALLRWCRQQTSPLVLAGSSMGGAVATAATASISPLGVFVVAPALFVPGYEHLMPQVPACPMTIVHGWQDEIIPWQNSVRFAAGSHVQLVLLDGDHRLIDVLDDVCSQFSLFLETIVAIEAGGAGVCTS
jgi:surfactin synthase thioesterase subunit